jgi:AcrR family transcriptional regulator
LAQGEVANGISKGSLYHYFESKQALLDALVDRMTKEAVQIFLPVVQDPGLTALQKFRAYFETSARWKSDQKRLIISLMRMWYTHENAFIRQKMTSESLKTTSRLLEPIIRQGIEEKVFTTRFPEQVAVVVTGVALSLTDTFIELLLSPQQDQAIIQEAQITLEAYVDTIERILGAPSGSLNVFDAADFKEWFVALEPEPTSERL